MVFPSGTKSARHLQRAMPFELTSHRVLGPQGEGRQGSWDVCRFTNGRSAKDCLRGVVTRPCVSAFEGDADDVAEGTVSRRGRGRGVQVLDKKLKIRFVFLGISYIQQYMYFCVE